MKNYVSDVVKLIDKGLKEYDDPSVFYMYMRGLCDMLNAVASLANNEEPSTAKADETDQETFFEPLSGRYFKSSKAEVANAVANANRQIVQEVFITINDWFDYLKLDPIWGGCKGGWDIDNILAVDIVEPEEDDRIRVPHLVYLTMPCLLNETTR